MKFRNYGWILLLPSIAFAYEGEDVPHIISVGAGIASPGAPTAVFTNPAGLIFTHGFNVDVRGGIDSSSDPELQGGASYGHSRTFGLSAGLTDYTKPGELSAYYGLGVGIEAIHTSFGISGTTVISPAGGSSLNAGVLIMPSPSFSLGFTAVGLNSGLDEIGAGLGLNFSSEFGLIVDTAFSKSFSLLGVEPALRVGGREAALTVGYAIQPSSSPGSVQIGSGFTVGGALLLAHFVNWQVYYNEFNHLYTSLSFRI